MIVIAAGQHIGDRYQLERRIAVGGMGEVWEASDNRLGRSVAVKILRPELSGDPEFLHRFRIEARTVASLDHHGIAAVHDYGESEGPAGRATAYLVMELVRGEPLSTHIARGPIEVNETLRLLEEAAWALQAAHERGFVHRDVKPGNILVRTDGVVKLTDFGIAKAADAVPVTRSGMVMGTAHYIAPEQASGAEAGPAGDVYSLGIVGFECLVGHRPFRAESAVAVAMMQVREAPPPLPLTFPSPVRDLIAATLVKDPTQRYATGGEFAAAVADVRRGRSLPLPRSLRGGAIALSRPVAGPNRTTGTDPEPAAEPVAAEPAVEAESPGTPAEAIPAPRPEPAPKPTPKPSVRELPAREARPRETPAREAPARDGRGVEPAASAPPPPVRPVLPAAAVPLRLHPVARSGRNVLVVLFVLLTLAAIALGVYLFQGGITLATVLRVPGSVTGWEGMAAGWVVMVRSAIPRTVRGVVR